MKQTALLPTLLLPIIPNMPPALPLPHPVQQPRVHTPPLRQPRVQTQRPNPSVLPAQPRPTINSNQPRPTHSYNLRPRPCKTSQTVPFMMK